MGGNKGGLLDRVPGVRHVPPAVAHAAGGTAGTQRGTPTTYAPGMLPPSVDGLEIAAAYRPAGDGSVVGGDFYDVFAVGDAEWVVVIGDVLGKGAPAAAVTSFVQRAVRRLAEEVDDPATLLHRLDRALAEHTSERFCTIVLVRLTRDGRSWRLRGAVGGHPLPLVRHPDGTVEEIGHYGSLVGILSDPTYTTFHHDLGEDLLVLATDGVVEGRRGREQFGDARLRRLGAGVDGDVAALTENVVGAVLEHQDQDAFDDIAVLALRAAEVSL
jgi:phosphoserine phosphatase RsbU/P